MIIGVELDFKNYVGLMYTLAYRKPTVIFGTVIGLIVLIDALCYYSGFVNIHIDGDGFSLFNFFFLFMTIMFPVFTWYNSKKNYAANKRIREKVVYEFTANEIKGQGETFSFQMNWQNTNKIIELKKWILIYDTNLTAIIMPKEILGDKLDSFKNMVRNIEGVNVRFRK